MQTCHRKHCNALGVVRPIIRVPFRGKTLSEVPALAVPVDAVFCEHCARPIRAGEFLFINNKRAITKLCADRAWPKPDFAKAWLDRGPVETPAALGV